ncbi:hypothetical protein KCP69_07180 [Salmonella enterica subsp. enterica]|nr:hypothetical protein KCP69_07180 [Salmonella enterica subsp. enterica]
MVVTRAGSVHGAGAESGRQKEVLGLYRQEVKALTGTSAGDSLQNLLGWRTS